MVFKNAARHKRYLPCILFLRNVTYLMSQKYSSCIAVFKSSINRKPERWNSILRETEHHYIQIIFKSTSLQVFMGYDHDGAEWMVYVLGYWISSCHSNATRITIVFQALAIASFLWQLQYSSFSPEEACYRVKDLENLTFCSTCPIAAITVSALNSVCIPDWTIGPLQLCQTARLLPGCTPTTAP